MEAERPEPRSMTMVDVLTLVAGVGLALVPALTPLLYTFPEFDIHRLSLEAPRFFAGAGLALTGVAWVRVGRYRRMPTAAEWLGFLVASPLLFNGSWLDIRRWDHRPYRPAPPAVTSDFLRHRGDWEVAAVFAALTLGGFVVLVLGRRVFPAWLRSALLGCLLLLAIAGPCRVLADHGPHLFAPRSDFQISRGSAWGGSTTGTSLAWKSRTLLFSLPLGLILGIPAARALDERIRRRPWSWLDWTDAIVATFAGFLWVPAYQCEFPTYTWPWLVEWLLLISWLVAIAILGRVIVARLGPTWHRWFGEDQDRSSSEAASAASTA